MSSAFLSSLSQIAKMSKDYATHHRLKEMAALVKEQEAEKKRAQYREVYGDVDGGNNPAIVLSPDSLSKSKKSPKMLPALSVSVPDLATGPLLGQSPAKRTNRRGGGWPVRSVSVAVAVPDRLRLPARLGYRRLRIEYAEHVGVCARVRRRHGTGTPPAVI